MGSHESEEENEDDDKDEDDDDESEEEDEEEALLGLERFRVSVLTSPPPPTAKKVLLLLVRVTGSFKAFPLPLAPTAFPSFHPPVPNDDDPRPCAIASSFRSLIYE